MRNVLLFLSFMVGLLGTFEAVLAAPSEGTRKQRNYPGGRDEEDLKVRSEIPNPTLKIHRKAIEEEVLKKMYDQAQKPSEKNTQQ